MGPSQSFIPSCAEPFTFDRYDQASRKAKVKAMAAGRATKDELRSWVQVSSHRPHSKSKPGIRCCAVVQRGKSCPRERCRCCAQYIAPLIQIPLCYCSGICCRLTGENGRELFVVTGGVNKQAQVFDVGLKKVKVSLKGHTKAVTAVASDRGLGRL